MPRCCGQPIRPDAIAFDPRDNVATSLADLRKGTEVRVAIGKTVVDLTVRDAIPVGHKIALQAVRKGRWITKYGERIGRATRTIRKGDHVHTHNLGSSKERTGRLRRR